MPEVPFSFREEGSLTAFKGGFTLDRRAFGVGGNSLTRSDAVTVHIYLKARKG